MTDLSCARQGDLITHELWGGRVYLITAIDDSRQLINVFGPEGVILEWTYEALDRHYGIDAIEVIPQARD